MTSTALRIDFTASAGEGQGPGLRLHRPRGGSRECSPGSAKSVWTDVRKAGWAMVPSIVSVADMARGISDLQKTILLFVMAQGGFASSKAIVGRVWGPSLTPEEARYDSAHASLSRSLSRLFARCLIDIFKKIPGAATGTCATVVGLTPEGEELARCLVEEEESG
jgi:hypothetical protein